MNASFRTRCRVPIISGLLAEAISMKPTNGREFPYPNGVLTEPYRPEFLPGTGNVNYELLSKVPVGDDKNLLSRIVASGAVIFGQETEESQRRFDAIVDALACELDVSATRPSPHFWMQMAIALMYRHVPALQVKVPKRRVGRSKSPASKHESWLDLYRTTRKRLGEDVTDAMVFRAMAKQARIKMSNDDPSQARAINIVKGHVTRALKWLEDDVEALKAQETLARQVANNRSKRTSG
jgi:hypothetical protein